MTSNFSVRINQGPEQVVITRTGKYDLAAAVAVGLLEYDEEKDGVAVVEIWVESLLPTYAPSFYEIDRDEFGNLSVQHLPGCERRPGGSIVMKAYQGKGEFKWFERRQGEWKPLAMWEPRMAVQA